MGHAAYNNTEYRKFRQWVKATGPACHLCGEKGADTVDHLVPLAIGGFNVSSNWAPAHAHCNYSKRSRVRVRYSAQY